MLAKSTLFFLVTLVYDGHIQDCFLAERLHFGLYWFKITQKEETRRVNILIRSANFVNGSNVFTSSFFHLMKSAIIYVAHVKYST
jgi:hypothetical protein